MLEVESPCQRMWPEVAKTATKPSPAPLHKHSLGGCTVDMPVECYLWGGEGTGILFCRTIPCLTRRKLPHKSMGADVLRKA